MGERAFDFDEFETPEGCFSVWGVHQWTEPTDGMGILTSDEDSLTIGGVVAFGDDDSERELTPEEVMVWVGSHHDRLIERVFLEEQSAHEAFAESR